MRAVGPIGFQEVVVILLLALIFLGPKKLPDIASGIGKAIREVRKATADIKQEIELDEAIRKPLEELREATMLPPEELKRRDEDRKWRERQEREERERLEREGKNGASDSALEPGAEAASDSGYSEDDYHDPDIGSTGDPDAEQSHAADTGSTEAPPAVATEPTVLEPPPATALPKAPGGEAERTIAMNLPPPMQGSASPYLPPPKPATPVRRPTPPPVPAAALKPPGDSSGVPSGTVPRVGSGATLVGMPPVTISTPPAEAAPEPAVDPLAATGDGKARTRTASKTPGKGSRKA
jgi:Tat protein translocase TatB subunit